MNVLPTHPPLSPEEEAERRRRVRRFGFLLLAFVALLVVATFAYVELYGHVLRDPELPPSVRSPTNPRVFMFELLLAAAIAVVITSVIVRRAKNSKNRR